MLLNKLSLTKLHVPGIHDPLWVRKGTSDENTVQDVLVRKEYRLRLARTPSTIVDAGANIGCASIFFAHEYPDARIIAIEPDTDNYEILAENVRPYRNISVVHAALWPSDAILEVVDPGLGHWGIRVRLPAAGAALEPYQKADGRRRSRSVRDILRRIGMSWRRSPARVTEHLYGHVPGISLPEIMRRFSVSFIDLLKVDIEGAEYALFAGPLPWLSVVGAIVMEVHNFSEHDDPAAVIAALGDFTVEMKYEAGSIHAKVIALQKD